MTHCLVSVLLLTAIATSASAAELNVVNPATAGFDATKLTAIEAKMQQHIDAGQLVGGMGLVARGEKIVFAKTWGQRDREKQLPMTEDTIFRIYSMTKPITSVAAMILVEQGKIKLNDPVSQYLPALANRKVLIETAENEGDVTTEEVPAKREMTVRDLMRHTSGFTYGFFGNSEVDKRYKSALLLVTDRTLEDTITKLAQIPLKYQPASRWHYSVSTDVLGRVIEVASGQSLAEYFAEHIFQPLQMEDTFFTVPPEKLDRLAQMYTPDDKGGLRPANRLQSFRFVTPTNRFYSGGGGLCSTTGDYLTFCQMLLNGGRLGKHRILKTSSVKEMTRNQLRTIPGVARGFKFGLGFSINARGAYGWGGAAGTKFSIDPRNDLIIIYMVQINPTGQFNYAGEMNQIIYSAIE